MRIAMQAGILMLFALLPGQIFGILGEFKIKLCDKKVPKIDYFIRQNIHHFWKNK